MQLTAYFGRNWSSTDGIFTIQDTDGYKYINRIQVRSGARGWTDTSWVVGKSPIPYGRFNLWTNPNREGQKAGSTGIGECFPIDSQGDKYTIRNEARTLIRTEIMLHQENDIPGTQGCIGVIKQNDWDFVSSYLRGLRDNGIEKIPLVVL